MAEEYEFTTQSDLLDLIGQTDDVQTESPVEGVPADAGGETDIASTTPSATEPVETPIERPVNHVVSIFAKRGFINEDAFQSDDELIDALNDRYAKLEEELAEARQQAAKVVEKPVEQPAPAAPKLAAKVSEEATKLRDIGLIAKVGTEWKATNPSFQKYADEFQQADIAARLRVQQFAYDPDQFLKETATPLIQETMKSYADKLAALEQQLAAMKTAAEQSKPHPAEAWIQQNSEKLWTSKDGTNVLTPVGEAYKAAEAQAAAAGISDPAIVAMMAQLAADQVSKVWKPEPKQTVVSEPEKPKKFLESAKANGQRPVNRLSEHQHPDDVAIPTDNLGNPDWDALMRQTAENL